MMSIWPLARCGPSSSRKRADRLLERRHGRPGKEPVCKMAQPGVIRRVAVDQQRKLPLEGFERRALRARIDPVVARRGEAVGVARKRPESVSLVVVCGCLVAQAAIGRIRVLVVLVIEGIVVRRIEHRGSTLRHNAGHRSFSMTLGCLPTGRIRTRSSEQSGAKSKQCAIASPTGSGDIIPAQYWPCSSQAA